MSAPCPSVPSCETGGFTLVELLVVIALVSVATALAAPPFGELIAARRLDSASAHLGGAVRLARSEAVKRAALVIVEPQTAGAWHGTLRVYLDAAGNPTDAMQGADTLIRVFERGGPVATVSGPARLALDAQGRSLALAADGSLQAAAVVLCGGGRSRTLTVDLSGTTTVATGSAAC